MSKQENNTTDDSEDNFGLPEIDFKPIDRETGIKEEISTIEPVVNQVPEAPEPIVETNETSYQEEPVIEPSKEAEEIHQPIVVNDEEKEGSPVIAGIIIAALIVAALLLTYFYVYKPKADRAAAEKLENEKVIALKAKAKQDSLLRVEEEQKRLAELKSAEKVKPTTGTIETLTGQTGNYHVIITSNIDDDLVMDFAKKLSLKGVSTKIIPPFGESKFYRLSIISEESFAKAQASADAAKAEFGNSLWVIKY